MTINISEVPISFRDVPKPQLPASPPTPQVSIPKQPSKKQLMIETIQARREARQALLHAVKARIKTKHLDS